MCSAHRLQPNPAEYPSLVSVLDGELLKRLKTLRFYTARFKAFSLVVILY